MNLFDRITELLTAADDRGDSCDEIDTVLKLIEGAREDHGSGNVHKWQDGWGNDRESEIVAVFNRGEFRWVTIWDERMNEFRSLPAGPKVLSGSEAFEQLSEAEQQEVFGMLMDEAGDESTRDRAHAFLEDMTLEEMREYLREMSEFDAEEA